VQLADEVIQIDARALIAIARAAVPPRIR